MKDVICGRPIHMLNISLSLEYGLCWLMPGCSFTTIRHFFFLICVAFILYPLCHWCLSFRKWQQSASWKVNEDCSQGAPPETKCATTFWSEHDLNHYSYETSVEIKLGIETSNYSGCQKLFCCFWKTAWWHLLTALDAIQWQNFYCNQ